MWGIYTHIPETNYVPREHGVADILLFLLLLLLFFFYYYYIYDLLYILAFCTTSSGRNQIHLKLSCLTSL